MTPYEQMTPRELKKAIREEEAACEIYREKRDLVGAHRSRNELTKLIGFLELHERGVIRLPADGDDNFPCDLEAENEFAI